MEPKQSVAVVGSGLAGLVTAHLLHNDRRQRYAVKVFECGNSLSLDAASVELPNATRTCSDRVDLPMRAFAGGFYNNLKSLYDHLKIPYHSQPFLFEFAQAAKKPSTTQDTPYFVHASNLHQWAPRPSAIGLLQYLLEIVYLAACYSWFSLCCFLVAPHMGETLRQYLKRTWTPRRFVTYYLLPLMSSVTTCPHEALLNFPASDLIEYKRRTHLAPHYTVSAGVKTVQDRLIRHVEYELGAVVKAVQPQEKGIKLTWVKNDAERTAYFDRIILAVAPDVVGQIFEPLQHHMRKMPTAWVESVVHYDHSVLAQTETVGTATERHGAQFIRLRTSTGAMTLTESHHLQPCGAIVTTCPHTALDPSLVRHSARFTRVLRSPQSQSIVNAIFGKDEQCCLDEKLVPQWRNGDDHVWLAGGWCWDGMVLLEGCVISAMRIAEDFDVEVPWQVQPRGAVEL